MRQKTLKYVLNRLIYFLRYMQLHNIPILFSAKIYSYPNYRNLHSGTTKNFIWRGEGYKEVR